MWLAFLAAAAQHPLERIQPRCTLLDELPVLIFVAENPLLASHVKVPNEKGVEVDVAMAAMAGMERHRGAHGGWPSELSSETLRDTRSVPCDPVALDVLRELAIEHPIGADVWIGLPAVAELLERNDRISEAEQVFEIAVRYEDAGQWPGSSCQFARFLVRRARFEEAWPLLPECEGGFSCGVCDMGRLDAQFHFRERCFEGLNGTNCLDQLAVLRYERLGWKAAGRFVARKLVASGCQDPVREALELFDRAVAPSLLERWVSEARAAFESDLKEWDRSPDRGIDWSTTAGVELAVVRARALLTIDPESSYWLFEQAAYTGFPIAGHALREVAVDPTIPWHSWRLDHLKGLWRTGLLRRTYGTGDPDDPATW